MTVENVPEMRVRRGEERQDDAFGNVKLVHCQIHRTHYGPAKVPVAT